MTKLSIGKISKDLGFALMKIGLNLTKSHLSENSYWTLKSAIQDAEFIAKEKIEIKQIESSKLYQIVKKQMQTDTWLWDGVIYYITLDEWKKIIRQDLIDRLKWILDKFDCDNFATIFTAFMSVFYGLNSAGLALGAVLDKNTKKVIGYHAYNVIVAEDSGEVKLFIYEPQNDTIKEAKRETDMDWTIYRTDLIIFR